MEHAPQPQPRQGDVKVYVAAKKSTPPKLPLREALITVAIECIYEIKPTQQELEQAAAASLSKRKNTRRRRRISLANFMRRRRNAHGNGNQDGNHKQLQQEVRAYSVYSHNEQTAGLTATTTLADYIESQNYLQKEQQVHQHHPKKNNKQNTQHNNNNYTNTNTTDWTLGNTTISSSFTGPMKDHAHHPQSKQVIVEKDLNHTTTTATLQIQIQHAKIKMDALTSDFLEEQGQKQGQGQGQGLNTRNHAFLPIYHDESPSLVQTDDGNYDFDDDDTIHDEDFDFDMDDMTLSTVALIGERNMQKMPSQIIITDANNISGKWWYEKNHHNYDNNANNTDDNKPVPTAKPSRISPLFFHDPEDANYFGETNMIKYRKDHADEGGILGTKPKDIQKNGMKRKERYDLGGHEDTMVDSILDKQIDADSGWCMEDMSTIVASTCMVFCPRGDVFSPDDHDLKLQIELDEDLKSLDRRQRESIQSSDDKHAQHANHWDYDDGANSSSDLFLNTMLDNSDGDHHMSRIMQRSIDQQDRLFRLLADRDTKPETVKMLLDEQPQALKMTRASDGKLPLHILCDQKISSETLLSDDMDSVDTILTSCIQNITNHRMFLKLVTWSYIQACSKHDKQGNLPCHLLAYQIISWTEELQKFLLRNDLNLFEMERMMMLSNIITECIDIVLRPIVTQNNACMSTGSMGDVLPLHISIIFGGSIDVFRSLLETYPEGAGTLLSLEGHRSVMPMALLGKIKVDQTQYHNLLCNGISRLNTPLEWHTTIPGSFYEEDMIRRADLLFCFNPTQAEISNARISRLEAMIKSEAKREKGNWSDKLSPATEAAWMWMCARYKNLEEKDICDEAIDRILRNLKPLHIQRLSNVTTEGGENLGFARPRVRKRVLEAASGQLLIAERRKEGLPVTRKKLTFSNRNSQSKMTSICKSIFAIEDVSIPVHFIVFPFMIEPSNDKQGMLVSESNATLAMEFSNFMLHETSPNVVLRSLAQKVLARDNLLLTKRDAKEQDDVNVILSRVYRKGAWLYFIDGHTGTPILGNKKNGKYPIPIVNAPKQVALLLPLMRMGMILMRKSQNKKILSQVIIKSMNPNSFPKQITTWPGAAQGIIECFKEESQTSPDSLQNREVQKICDDLSTFISWNAREGRDEFEHLSCIDWSLEFTLLQFVLESTGLTAENIETEVDIERRKSYDLGDLVWTGARPRAAKGHLNRKAVPNNLAKVQDLLEHIDDKC